MKTSPSFLLRNSDRWANFRFSVIGHLLSAPPTHGKLQERIHDLARREWIHPISNQPFRVSFSTIERWYYAAGAKCTDPISVLRRKVRSDSGEQTIVNPRLSEAIRTQFHQHPSWSYQLHFDNLKVLASKDPDLQPVPSYSSLLRFMKSKGLIRRPRRGPPHSPGAQIAEHRFESREIRSFEVSEVNGLWHLDFHHGSLRVLRPDGSWCYPILFGCLDDHSRLCCHAQWYFGESAEVLVHGLSQALQKRGLPRALLTDNGSAMLAEETTSGLFRLAIVHQTTLPYSPYQNGKQESFWGQIEGRLLPMMEGISDLSLHRLNTLTQSWVEKEYNIKIHSQLQGQTPLQRFLKGTDVGRSCPDALDLKMTFTSEALRTQRRTDGTISIGGTRFQIPSNFRHFLKLAVRWASWDLSHVYLADQTSGKIIQRIFPLDKTRNANGFRPLNKNLEQSDQIIPPPSGLSPLLEKLEQDQFASGLPPAFIPLE